MTSRVRTSEPDAGTELPFSKGLLARTLMGTGLSPERSYELARLIEQCLARKVEPQSASREMVDEITLQILAEQEGAEAVERLREFRLLSERDVPLLLLVGGATGTGKSTVVTEVAHRLGITRVTSTDFVRQTMRAFFSSEFMPTIHHSSYEAGRGVQLAEREDADPDLFGFLDQTRNVLVGVRAVLDRAIAEGHPMAIEGIHIVPGLLPLDMDDAVICQCILAIPSEHEHEEHFWIRSVESEGLRQADKYVEALPTIRLIQEYLLECATQSGVPVFENTEIENAVQRVIGLVLETSRKAKNGSG